MKSLLDNDLYKFTMMQAVWERYPTVRVRYEFINRRLSDHFTERVVECIQERVNRVARLMVTPEELRYLGTLGWLKPAFLHFLQSFRLRSEDVFLRGEDGRLRIHIEGSWVDTILWEVPLMAIISEVYFEEAVTDWNRDLESYYLTTLEKGIQLTDAGCSFMDFGTRRRRSYEIHDAVVRAFADKRVQCMGTSNVHFAMKYGMRPIGTMAHEWIMGHAGMNGILMANETALRAWLDVYGGALDTALTDTYTTDLFLENISGELARTYTALRHDSECPIKFADKVLDYYEQEGIDPKEKAIVFSDSLSVAKAIEIERHVAGRTKTLYGIGTHFTNDFEGSAALNIVIKLYEISGVKVAKISDNPRKASGDPVAVAESLKVIEQVREALV